MPKENLIPIENKKPFETVYELKNEVPSLEEFMKTYESDEKVNYDDLNSGDIGEAKGYGPCTWDNSDCSCYQSELQRRYWVAANNNDYTIQVNIVNIWINRWPGTRPQSLPSINNVTFNTTGSTKPDNYRGVGTWFGLVGNIVGGLIEDSSRHKASGVLFASNRRNPLSFWNFYETGTAFTIIGDRVDFHDDKIVCGSKSDLNELESKIGNIVEVFEWSFANVANRVDKERELKSKIQRLLDKHSEGEDINGHYTI